MNTIDQRVVEMRFDNKQFESGVKTSIDSINSLKKSLDMSKAVDSFSSLEKAGNKVSFDGLASAVESVTAKFSAMEVVAFSAISNITNRVIDAGIKMAKSLSVDQISAGWQKYADKTSAVQTIIAATGKNIDEVSAAIEKLNWFTDETSFNLTEMTAHIGRFTSNNIDLKTSITAIQGIADACGLAGVSSEKASHAMEGFSKAMAQGSMKRDQWQWIQTAGLNTAWFKESIIDAALAAGTLVKSGNELRTALEGSAVSVENFESAMSEGWVTSEVILDALQNYGAFTDVLYAATEKTNLTATELLTAMDQYKAGTLDLADLADKSGESIENLDMLMQFLNMDMFETGVKAFKASQEAKTFAEAISAVKDAVSTGWMTTFELLFGNYEEAKVLWTGLSNTLWDVFAASGEVRNAMLQEWKDEGGRIAAIEAVCNAFNALIEIVELAKEAFRDVFPAVTGSQLADFTKKLRDMTANLKIGETAADNLKRTFKGVFAIFSIGKQLLSAVGKAAMSVLQYIAPGAKTASGALLSFTGSIGDWLVKADQFLKKSDLFNKAFAAMGNIVKPVVNGLEKGVRAIGNFVASARKELSEYTRPFEQFFSSVWQAVKKTVQNIGSMNLSGVKKLSDRFKLYFQPFEGVKDSADAAYQALKDLIQSRFPRLYSAIEAVKGFFEPVRQWITEAYSSVSQVLAPIFERIRDAFDELEGISFENAAEKLDKFKERIKTAFDGIDKLGEKLKGSLDNVKSTLGSFGTWLSNKFSNFNISALFVGVLGGTMVGSMVKIGKVTDALSEVFGEFAGIATRVQNVIAALTKSAKAEALNKMASAVKKLAESIAIMVAALIALTFVPTEDLDAAFDTLMKVTALVTAFSVVARLIGTLGVTTSSFKSVFSINLNGAALTIVAYAAALKIVTKALKELEELDPAKVISNLNLIIKVMVSMAVMGAIGRGATFSSGMGLLASVLALKAMLKIVKEMSQEDLQAMFSSMGQIKRVIESLLLVFVAVGFGGRNAAKVALMFLSMGVALRMIAGCIKIIANLAETTSFSAVDTAVKSIQRIMLMMDTMMMSSIMAGKNSHKAALMLASASGFLVTATFMIGLLSALGEQEVKSAVRVMAALTLMLDSVMLSAGYGARLSGGEKSFSGFTGLAAAFAALAISVVALAMLDEKDLVNAGVVVIAMEGLMGALILAASKLEKSNMGAQIATFVALGAIIAELTVCLGLLSKIPSASLLPAATALGGMLLAMSVAMGILSKIKMDTSVIGQAALMGLVVAELAAIFGLMSSLGFEASDSTVLMATSLGIMINTLASACVILSYAEFDMGMVGKAAIMAAIMAALGAVVGYLESMDVAPSIETAIAMGILINSLSAACILLGVAGGFAATINLGLEALGILVAGLAIVVGALYALDPDPAQVQKAMDILTIISTGVGNMIGGFIGGAIETMLEKVANGLTKIVGAVETMVDTCSGIDDSAKEKLSVVGDVLGSMAGLSFKSLDKIPDDLGTKLGTLGTAVGSFAEGLPAGVNLDKLSTGAEAMSHIMSAIDQIPSTGGFWQMITGSKDISGFGTSIEKFAEGVKKYSEKLGNTNLDNITNSVPAVDALMAIADKAPKTGGLWQDIAGTTALDTLGKQLESFADGMNKYSEKLRGVDLSIITGSKDAALALTEIANSAPRTGGDWQKVAGEKDLAALGNKLSGFGQALYLYSTHVAQIQDFDAIANSVTAAQGLVDVASAVAPHGGIIQQIAGEKDLGLFSNQLVKFGLALGSYGRAVTGMDFTAVTNSVSAASSFVTVADKLAGSVATWAMAASDNPFSWAAKVALFGQYMADYANAVKDINAQSIEDSVAAVESFEKVAAALTGGELSSFILEGMVTAISNGSPEVMLAFNTLFDNVGATITFKSETITANMDALMQSLTSSVTTEAVNTVLAMGDLLTDMSTKITDDTGISTAFDTLMTSVTSALSDKKTDFENTAKDFLDGFALGLQNEEKIQAIITAATNIGDTAVTALRNSIDAHSPAILPMRAGKDFDDGFAIGIESNSAKVGKAADAVGVTATKRLNKRMRQAETTGSKVLDTLSKGYAKLTDAANEYGLTLNSITDNDLVKLGAKYLGIDDIMTDSSVTQQASTAGQTVGRSYSRGVASGVQQSQPTVLEETQAMNERVLESIEGKHRNTIEVGTRFVKLVAEGISEDTTAEEAAKVKAEAIVNAFSETIDSLTKEKTISDLEYQLWEAFFPDASDEDKAVAKVESLTNQTISQFNKGVLAFQKYEAAMKSYGETSDESREAYADYLQEMIDYQKLLNELKEYDLSSLPADTAQTMHEVITELSAETIRGSTELKSQVPSWMEAGSNLVEGLAAGIVSKTSAVREAIAALGLDSLSTLMSVLQEHSPSHATFKMGEFFDMGLVGGIIRRMKEPGEQAEKMGEHVLKKLKKSMADISDAVDSNIELTPTIRPVLDMSEIQRHGSEVGRILAGGRGIKVSGVTARVAAMQDAQAAEIIRNQAYQKNFNYTQNVYSPKAVSRAEIYRQTKNALSKTIYVDEIPDLADMMIGYTYEKKSKYKVGETFPMAGGGWGVNLN